MNDKDFKAVQSYISDVGTLAERAIRTDKARRKRGEKIYCSRLNVPYLEECYIINPDGQKGICSIVISYGNRYYYCDTFYQVDGTTILNVNVFTSHFLERYRCRNNMYATSIENVLFDIVKNSTMNTQAHTERFDRALVMNNNCCIPVQVERIFVKGQRIMVTTYITYLNEQDKKVRNLGIAAQNVDNEVNKMFDEDTIKNTKKYV